MSQRRPVVGYEWIDEVGSMPMLNPPHPCEVIKELCLKSLKLNVTQAAQCLGVSRNELSQLLNGHAGISPTMALRLSLAFGGSPESWIQQQTLYDLAQARKQSANLQVNL